MSHLPDPAQDLPSGAENPSLPPASSVGPRLERLAALLTRYANDTDRIALAVLSDPSKALSGREGEVRFQQTFSRGKQQPVCGYQLTFPEGEVFELVLRGCPTRHANLLADPLLVKMLAHFPEILRTVHAGSETSRSALWLEAIDGSDDKSDASDYLAQLTAPGGIDRLIQDIFPGICEIYESGLSIADLAPHAAHNVMYDRKADRFRLVDLGCVLHWNQPLGFFVDALLGPQLQHPSTLCLEYLAKMLSSFERAYPGELENPSRSRPTSHYFVHTAELAAHLPGAVILTPDMPEHRLALAHLFLDLSQRMPRVDQPLLVCTEEVKFYANPRLLEAAKSGDLHRIARALDLANHKLGKQCRA